MKNLTILIILTATTSLSSLNANAQKWAVSINAGDALMLGSIGMEYSYATGQHITINTGARMNPWTFRPTSAEQFQSRHQTYYAGVRYWYWNAYSGWWTGTKCQFQEYNRGGIISQITEEGNAYGIAVNGGYSLMLSRHLNLDFGVGFWSGIKHYTEYSCPKCGQITASGTKTFIMPDELIISLSWIF